MKKIQVFILFMSLSAAIPSVSFGEMHNGNMLLDDCKQFLKYMDNKEDPSVSMSSIGFCLGYIQGHMDFQQYLQKNFTSVLEHCVPGDVSVSQLAKVAVKYLESNPDKLQKPAIEIVRGAFAESFPCTESPAQSSR